MTRLMPHSRTVLLSASLALAAVGSSALAQGPSGRFSAPAVSAPDARGYSTYVNPPTYDATSAAQLRPGQASAEAAVVHYLASRVRRDRAFETVLAPLEHRDRRFDRALAEHETWTFTSFRLVGRMPASRAGDLWVKAWFRITVDGEADDGTDDFTLRELPGGRWVLVDLPT